MDTDIVLSRYTHLSIHCRSAALSLLSPLISLGNKPSFRRVLHQRCSVSAIDYANAVPRKFVLGWEGETQESQFFVTITFDRGQDGYFWISQPVAVCSSLD